MQFRTHNDDPNIDMNGTALVGTIQATRAQITRVFGESLGAGDKTFFNWIIQFENGVIGTVYDWKSGVEPGPNQLMTWHIGGHDRRAAELVHAAFREGLSLNVKAA